MRGVVLIGLALTVLMIGAGTLFAMSWLTIPTQANTTTLSVTTTTGMPDLMADESALTVPATAGTSYDSGAESEMTTNSGHQCDGNSKSAEAAGY